MTETLTTLAAVLADRYLLERELGRGATATVYVAEDRKHGRRVGIKVLRRELAAQLGPERFLREIAIAARLTHPHIVPLLDSGEAGGFLYYVMPFLQGESLRHRLARERPLPLRDALHITRNVGTALDYAHREGVIHRDVKPENILLTDGHALIADFGIARAIAQAGSSAITEPGLAIGTPAYMSPEQAGADQDVDARTDLYSLACVLFEMLAGEPPFSGATALRIIARQVSELPRPLRSVRPDTPAAVEQAVARALAKEPAGRFASIAEFLEALEPGAESARARSIAVLPFANTSADPENEYFSDGMTDELINALTKVEGLRVASRTSVFALKGAARDVRAIGSLLGVSTVLEGTVRKSGDRLRITARLTATDDGRHLWSERYDRTLHDVFAIQDEIARLIVGTLRTIFQAELGDPTPQRYTRNLDAYGLYLRGRFCWNKRSREGVVEAIHYFEEAIARDPEYALAYAGLADAYALQVDYRGMPVIEGFARARSNAERALALDETLAEAHTSLAWLQFIYDWDWERALGSFRRALELNPAYATAHQWYSFLLMVLNEREEALTEIHRALDLDPASVSIRRSVGFLHYYSRQHETAIEHLQRAIAMNPTQPETYRLLGLVLTQLGRYDEAERAFRDSLSDETAYAAASLGYLHGVRGRRDEAEAVLARLDERARTGYVSPVAFVMVHLGLRNLDQVFIWLMRAYEERRGWLAYLKVEPMVDPIRNDPRFPEWLVKMNLNQ